MESERYNGPVVSIVVPFFNEHDSVELFFSTMASALKNIPNVKFEFVCVDDGSSDGTLANLLDVARADSRVVVVELSRNFGKEAALTAGIDVAVGDAVIPIDADLQDPPALIGEMIGRWQRGADVVLAKRTDRRADSLAKRQTAKFFYKLQNAISDVRVPENVGDFRLMDRICVDALKRMPERQRFMKGMFAWLGFKADVVEYKREPRSAGVSKFNGWKLWNFALDGFTSFSSVPLRMWTYLGLLFALGAAIYLVSIIVETLIRGVSVPGYASLLVVVLFFGGLQLVSIGVLGEYVGRVYIETKQRPIYIVRKVYGERDGPKCIRRNVAY